MNITLTYHMIYDSSLIHSKAKQKKYVFPVADRVFYCRFWFFQYNWFISQKNVFSFNGLFLLQLYILKLH